MQLNGARLRQARQRRLMSLRELSKASGVAVDTISKLENGLQQPRMVTLRKLAKALDASAEDWLEWPEIEGKATPLAA